MAEKIKNIPSPDILMNSLRSIGYSFKTAVADIIDNSISADAKNIWIDFPSYSSDNLYITILDDAIGMDDAALFNAMKYGSERDEYGEKDLGRFGVGLKSASLSQCRTLTVMSKFNGDIHAYRWDLDEVLRSKEWECLRLDFDEIQACPNYEKLNSLVQGTMVVWQNFDIADQKSNGHAYEYLSEKLDESESHLCLIFHRFMNRSISPVSFFINDRQLKGLDPFLEGSPHHKRNPKTDEGKPVEMAVKYYDKGYEKEAMIKVQTFILPHQDDLSKEDVEALGGMEVLKDEQGFFVYRNDRLIIYGTWFRLSSRSVNAELYKYGRIKVDITINDNRISLYSRGKLGEYDILSKIKNNRNSEAYVIGELYVDIFEQDGLADMAISNRRGYEENDPRYIEVIKIAKRLLGYIVGQKDIVSKRRKEDDQRIEDEKIKKKFWENPQTREILELRLNDAEKQVVQEENLQFTRAVNNGKQTKKIFISHKEEHKLYGQFIVDVLETYGVDVVSTIIFTGDRRLGVPQGKDIYDYLKDCFREDLMVIFLFSKAFYDSNICISEAGAAWATNQNCMNVVIDISFSDIEKPSNNALSSIKFQQIRTPDQTITVTEFFKTIIEEGLHFEYDESKLQKALNYVLKTDKYSDQKIDFPATFLPKRKFLPVPRCPKCHNIMLLTEENGRLKYVCSNVSCDECYEAVIN